MAQLISHNSPISSLSTAALSHSLPATATRDEPYIINPYPTERVPKCCIEEDVKNWDENIGRRRRRRRRNGALLRQLLEKKQKGPIASASVCVKCLNLQKSTFTETYLKTKYQTLRAAILSVCKFQAQGPIMTGCMQIRTTDILSPEQRLNFHLYPSAHQGRPPDQQRLCLCLFLVKYPLHDTSMDI
ncbi:hypothetical protein M9H77_13635 [Catharanthus roseus]|uniref:Uncharacterized protein n=1 Tax=Catharanthus roseus TaxID=4058 RepID=A0ACC0BKZ8_CATRO|nr:hypothetical protein M9H77_13635 [Catharanthus roseus]